MIRLEKVSYAYPSAETVHPEPSLHDVDFELNEGELVALVGANGAGKSTLGRVLCATFKPSEGRVLYNDAELEENELHRLVGYVRQDPSSQLVAPTVFDEVAFGPCNLGLSEEEVRERIAWALGAVNLSGYEERLVSELSGGELQRLSLAGVLAMKPQYLVLDEVTSQLDGIARETLRSIVAEQASAGVGVVMIVHDAIEVARSNRVVLIEDGTVSWQGSPKEFFETPSLISRAHLRVPTEPKALQGVSSQIPNPELLFEDVTVAYDGLAALNNVSLVAKKGEILLVVGRSGSGKSTLASVGSGLIEPDAGKVLLDGKAVQLGQVALCMQRPEAQLFCDSVLEDVAFGPLNSGATKEEARARAKEALQALDVSEAMWEKSPFLLSGGQRRRVALAGIVALDTNVLIFDEPTVGLDANGREHLKACIASLAKQGKAVVVVSHDIDEWLDIVHEVVLLEAGECVWMGSAKELFAQPLMLKRAGLGVAPWEQMSVEFKRLGVSAPSAAASAPGVSAPSAAAGAPSAAASASSGAAQAGERHE